MSSPENLDSKYVSLLTAEVQSGIIHRLQNGNTVRQRHPENLLNYLASIPLVSFASMNGVPDMSQFSIVEEPLYFNSWQLKTDVDLNTDAFKGTQRVALDAIGGRQPIYAKRAAIHVEGTSEKLHVAPGYRRIEVFRYNEYGYPTSDMREARVHDLEKYNTVLQQLPAKNS